MSKLGKKPIIGLLGGMCSGKSTAAKELAKLGCAIIDADEISHKLLDDRDVRGRIVRLFGRGVLDDKGGINRSELANKVFSDADKPAKRKASKLSSLTGVLHPMVLARVEQLITAFTGQPEVKAIVLDMPLLMEVGWVKRCDRIIFIDCKAPLRLKRAQKTGVFDARTLKIRENLQISLDKKRRIADNIVDNNSDLSGLSRQIADIFSRIIDKE